MPDPEVDILLKARDMATDTFNKVSKSGSTAGQAIQKHWKAASVALGVAAIGIEKIGGEAKKTTESINKLSITTGISSDELRHLVTETANYTRPVKDVLVLFKQAQKQGVEGAEALKKYAAFWDTVGDATGESSESLAKASAGLRAIGIDANNSETAVAAFGYITENTNSSVSEFLKLIEMSAPELQEMNLSVDQVAAVMGILESKGISGRMAQREFRTALTSSNGSLDTMLETLGSNREELGKYVGDVEGSKETINKLADAHAESYTIIDKMKHGLSELSVKHGELLGSMTAVAPVMMAAGPTAKGIQLAYHFVSITVTKTLIPALISLKTSIIAIHIAGGPLLWLIEGLAVAIVIFAVAWAKNWGGIQESTLKALNWIGDAIITAVNFWLGIFETWVNKTIEVLNMLPGVAIEWEAKFGDIGKNWSLKLGDGFKKGMEMSVGKIQEAFNKVEDVVSGKESKLQGQEIGTELINQMAVGVEENTALIDVISEQVKKIKAPLEEAAAKSSEAWKAGFTGISTGMGSLVELVGGKSKELFALQKGASIATAIMNANEAATKAMAKFPGPLGMALAGVVYGAAMANVAVIAAQEMAEGGIVKRPTLALVGEAGPEAVIPLNKMGRGGDTFNFSITGPFMGTPAEARLWARKLRPYLNDENAR